MLSRLRLSAAAFMIVLALLSVAQILIDTGIGGVSTDVGTAEDSKELKKVYKIFIEIEDKTLYLMVNGKCIKEYTIASGKSGYPSPLGCWTIIEKGDWGEGFGGRWLGLDVPWGTYRFGLN